MHSFHTSFPGYVDAHVHLKDAGAVADLVRAGIVAARDAGMREAAGTARIAPATGIRILSAVHAIVPAQGYGAFLGAAVATRQEMREEIRRLRAAGAGIIKVIASGVVSLRQPKTVTAGGFGADELRFMVAEAAAAGLSVMAHANGAEAIRAAALAGVRSVEHGFFMSEGILDLLAERRIFWVPTVGALKRAADAIALNDEMRKSIDRTIEEHLEMIRKAFSLGVPLAVGTDVVLPDERYSGWYQDELAYFRKAGIPADAVDRIATKGGRELLGLNQVNERR